MFFVEHPVYRGYLVTDDGDVISLKGGKWFYLTKLDHHNGYLRVKLSTFGVRYVHRLVMEGFFGKSALTVNHLNCNKSDNRLENLEYATQLENNRHARRMGRLEANKVSEKRKKAAKEAIRLLDVNGEKNPNSKLTNQQVIKLRSLKGTMTQKEAADLFSLNQTTVSDIWKEKTWKHLIGLKA